MDRIGPYMLQTKLLHESGRQLWAAANMDGEAFLVQTLRLKNVVADETAAPEDSAADPESEHGPLSVLQKREKQIAQRTARLLGCQSIPAVHAHGGMTDENGSRVLYWGMKAQDETPIERSELEQLISTPLAWIKLAQELVGQVRTTQADGHVLAHLSPAWLSHPTPDKETRCLGIGVFINPDWLEEDERSVNPAPEEVDECLPIGDFWRLGHCLGGLVSEEWPKPFGDFTAQLSAPQVGDRLSDFESIEAKLRALETSLEDAEPRISTASTEIQQVQSLTKDERPRDPSESGENTDLVMAKQQSGDLPLETKDERARAVDEDLVEPEEDEGEGSSGSIDIPKDLSEVSTSSEGFENPETFDYDEDEDDSETNSSPRLEAEAAAWAAPVLPVGASPWSEIVSARGTHPKKAHSEFPGFSEELPDHLEVSTSEEVAPDEDLLPLDNSDPELDFVVSGFSVPKIAIGAVALLSIFGFFLMILRSSEPVPVSATNHWLVNSFNEVILEIVPSNAIIVAEQDGSELGHSPQRFLTPSDSFVSVMMWAPGYEAQSLVLPDRGRLRVSLRPLPKASSCRLKLQSATNVGFEGVGIDLGTPPRHAVSGAVIVRASRGESMQGARIVRCPKLGGSPAQVLHFDAKGAEQTVRVTSPAKGRLYVNGSQQGKIPRTVKSGNAFVRLTVEINKQSSQSWWVPVEDGGEIQLPKPHSTSSDGGHASQSASGKILKERRK